MIVSIAKQISSWRTSSNYGVLFDLFFVRMSHQVFCSAALHSCNYGPDRPSFCKILCSIQDSLGHPGRCFDRLYRPVPRRDSGGLKALPDGSMHRSEAKSPELDTELCTDWPEKCVPLGVPSLPARGWPKTTCHLPWQPGVQWSESGASLQSLAFFALSVCPWWLNITYPMYSYMQA